MRRMRKKFFLFCHWCREVTDRGCWEASKFCQVNLFCLLWCTWMPPYLKNIQTILTLNVYCRFIIGGVVLTCLNCSWVALHIGAFCAKSLIVVTYNLSHTFSNQKYKQQRRKIPLIDHSQCRISDWLWTSAIHNILIYTSSLTKEI